MFPIIPKDPEMLLSFLNTQLRDNYDSLEALCEKFNLDPAMITKTLEAANYVYDAAQNQFK